MCAQTASVATMRTAETADRSLLSVPDALRARHFAAADPGRQRALGQFLTPPHVADLMAEMFSANSGQIRLLDAGAGMGMLSAAFVRRQALKPMPPRRIEVTAYELDQTLTAGLEATYETCRAFCQERGIAFAATIRHADFIAAGAEMLRRDLFSGTPDSFDAAIVNPPYGKLATASAGHRLLAAVGAETTNLYAAFLNLIIGLLKPQGELVAITPRSFCNGPYFKPFRRRLLAAMALRRLHVFQSRTAAFRHDSVLQENVILYAVKAAPPPRTIRISQSGGAAGDPVDVRCFPAGEIVSPADPEAFIHLPTSAQHLTARDQVSQLGATLAELGLTVSTGRVVDFRAREYLRREPEAGACPLIYPCHFAGLFVAWPKAGGRKPNAIRAGDGTRSLLVPAGIYVLTKRFTAKEERRRVVACVYDPSRVAAGPVGFENHLNYIHAAGQGLELPLAKGLWAYLNSSALDLYFRQFNGHTQVNATDLRNIRFPTARQLRRLGCHLGDETLAQVAIDELVSRELRE